MVAKYFCIAWLCIISCSTIIHAVHIGNQRDTRHFPVPDGHKMRDWMAVGQDELRKALDVTKNTNVAKNVILFIGDGMSLGTVWASRVYKGQYKFGVSGEEQEFEFENFPSVALAKTYNVDHQISDSAGTATAYLSGQKANYGTVGVNQHVTKYNCSNQEENKLDNIVDWSHEEGKWTGVVTTARITHASPAGAYAHSAQRYWECDGDFDNVKRHGPENKQYNCNDIARQLVEDGSDIRVVLGGGRQKMVPNNVADPEYNSKMGCRKDGRNLIQEWQDAQDAKGASYEYVWRKQEFDAVNVDTTDYLLGLFEPNHMQYELDRDPTMEPSIAEMTEKAIGILKKNDKGFFLFVEAARIDHGHHDSYARRAMEDTVALNDAVKKAMELTDEEDTLIIVTADHSHGFMSTGYTGRGNDILGIVDVDLEISPAYDGLPYQTLIYANGPSGLNRTTRRDVTNDDTLVNDYRQQSLVGMDYTAHSGEDVPIYARGPMAHLFHSVHEQNYIAHVMGYASCVGPNKDHCNEPNVKPMPCSGPALFSSFHNAIIILLALAMMKMF